LALRADAVNGLFYAMKTEYWVRELWGHTALIDDKNDEIIKNVKHFRTTKAGWCTRGGTVKKPSSNPSRNKVF